MTESRTLPFIAREDFDNFRRDVGLSNRLTYAEWTSTLFKQIDTARSEGMAVAMTPIIYDDFRTYCRSSGCQPNYQMVLFYSRFKRSVDTQYRSTIWNS